MTGSTNALIAALRAVDAEIRRAEARSRRDDLSDEAAEEAGLYLNDLHEALAHLSEDYEKRRSADPDLTPVEKLLAHFAREEAS